MRHNSHSSQLEPRKLTESLSYVHSIKAIKEELDQFDKVKFWTLVPKLNDKSIIRTKWVHLKKLNKSGEVIRNKAR